MLKSDYDCRTKNRMLGSWDHSMNTQTALPPPRPTSSPEGLVTGVQTPEKAANMAVVFLSLE